MVGGGASLQPFYSSFALNGSSGLVKPVLLLRYHFYLLASWLANEKCQAFPPAFSLLSGTYRAFPLLDICIFIRIEADTAVMIPLYLLYGGPFKSETWSLVFNLRKVILPGLLESAWTKSFASDLQLYQAKYPHVFVCPHGVNEQCQHSHRSLFSYFLSDSSKADLMLPVFRFLLLSVFPSHSTLLSFVLSIYSKKITGEDITSWWQVSVSHISVLDRADFFLVYFFVFALHS